MKSIEQHHMAWAYYALILPLADSEPVVDRHYSSAVSYELLQCATLRQIGEEWEGGEERLRGNHRQQDRQRSIIAAGAKEPEEVASIPERAASFVVTRSGFLNCPLPQLFLTHHQKVRDEQNLFGWTRRFHTTCMCILCVIIYMYVFCVLCNEVNKNVKRSRSLNQASR